jgi:thiamine transport system ATP-binding protein
VLTVTDVTVGFPGLTAVDGVSLSVPERCVLALLGPSGCGKSTLLRAIAGLEPLRGGRVAWDGTDLARIPVHRRSFGLMFQDGVLFPHRTVAQNVGYGLRVTGVRGTAADHRVAELLDLVGLGGFGGRSVTELSGGEAQRVALARALAPRPRLLLLDEPLAALDRSLRDSLLTDLKAILDETATPAIFVTHDQEEAFAVADRVALMRSGRIVQTGTPTEVWSAPADEWAAGFVGYTALVSGTVEVGSDGTPGVRTDLGTVVTPRRSGGEADLVLVGSAVRLAVRPAALVVDDDGELAARCVAVVPGPDRTTLAVELAGNGTVVSAVATGHTRVDVGQAVRLRFDPSAAAVVGSGGPGTASRTLSA